ncbi:MAG: hypothetical protein HON27_11610 [Candidatus Marinimicrobia bacterium]|jgi:hypothetical protein|nr:hypothetical protein [Candidatus Neomarinimicrobiota bacterium]MBT5270586.1 hypothetical protein [Candidatus Neomarinimicrobiota bacterium]
MVSESNKQRIKAVFTSKTDEELIEIAHLLPDDYTPEGVQIAKEILIGRGVTEDSAKFQQAVPEIGANLTVKATKPKFKTLLNFKSVVWTIRLAIIYSIFKDTGAEDSDSGTFILGAVVALALTGIVEFIYRRREDKVKEELGSRIKAINTNVNAVLDEEIDLLKTLSRTNNIEDTVCEEILNQCFTYDTSSQIDSIENATDKDISPNDRKVLDTVLGCMSIGAAIKYLEKRYGGRAINTVNKIQEKVISAIISNETAVEDSVDRGEVSKLYIELISDYPNLMDDESEKYEKTHGTTILDGIDGTMSEFVDDLAREIVSPFRHELESFTANKMTSLIFLISYNDAVRKTRSIIKVAEEKYNFNPTMS